MKQVNNCYLTYSTYDVKAFLESHKSYYRVGYNKDIGLWMISDSMIHYNMVDCAHINGDLDDIKVANARTDHLYYVPGIYSSEEFKLNYIEICEIAIYDNFVLGRGSHSSNNYFQEFMNIFGEPIDVRDCRHRKVVKRKNTEPISNLAATKCNTHNLFVEQARKWLPPRNISNL